MKNDVSWHKTAPNDKQYEQDMEDLDKEDTFALVEVNYYVEKRNNMYFDLNLQIIHIIYN